MKTALSFFCLTMVVTGAQAQFIGLNLGYALPSGSFANKTASASESGFAKTGYTIGLNVNYKIAELVGLSVDFNHMAMDMDEDALTSEAAKKDKLISQIDVVNAYSSNVCLAGAYVAVPIKKVSFQFKLATGFAGVRMPEKRTIKQLSGNEYISIQNPSLSNAVAFSWGLGISYNLNQKVGINFRLDEIYASTKYNVGYKTNNDNRTEIPFHIYTATLGVAVRIQ